MAESRRISILIVSKSLVRWNSSWGNFAYAQNRRNFTGEKLGSSKVGHKFWWLTCLKRLCGTPQVNIFRGLISRKMTKTERKYKGKGRQLQRWRSSKSVHWRGTLMGLVRLLCPLTNWGKEEYVECKMLMSKSELEWIHVLL